MRMYKAERVSVLSCDHNHHIAIMGGQLDNVKT